MRTSTILRMILIVTFFQCLDDFDEFDDTDETNSSRNYVSLNPEHKPADGASEAGETEDGKVEITDEKSRDGAPAGEQAPVPSATVTVEETVE